MSGGALDYIHNRLQDTAEQISRYSQSRQDRDQLQAFAGAIQHFAEVLRAIDYDLSDDQSLSAGMYDAMDMYTKVAKGVYIHSPSPPVVKESLTTALTGHHISAAELKQIESLDHKASPAQVAAMIHDLRAKRGHE